jgi:hypothetical protein
MEEVRGLLALGPVSIIQRLESWHALNRTFGRETAWIEAGMLMLGLSVYGAALLLLRWQCLRRADRLLGRVEEAPHRAEASPTVALVEAAAVAAK